MGAVKHWVNIILFLIKASHLENLKEPKPADNKVLSEEYFISLKHSSDKPAPCNYPHKDLLDSVLVKKIREIFKAFLCIKATSMPTVHTE